MSRLLEKAMAQQQENSWEPQEEGLAAIHPSAHLLVLFGYLFTVASFGKYEWIQLVPLMVFPGYLFYQLEMPLGLIIRKLLWIEPFILFIAILNPFLDPHVMVLLGHEISAGWLTFASLIFKSLLTLTVALQFGLMLGIDGLSKGLLQLKVPEVFVSVISLLFRYLSVLVEETLTLFRAYRMRAPQHKGVHFSMWGSFAGQLILRSYDRALRIENAMHLRGYFVQRNKDVRAFKGREYLYIGIAASYLIGVKWLSLIS